MRLRNAFAALALAVGLAAATPARAQSFSVEAFGGWQNLRLSADSVGGATRGDEGTGIFGGDVLLGLGPLGVGAVVDRTVRSDGPWAGALLAGFLLPLPVVRVELLGEIGRRAPEFGDLFDSGGQTFAGFRPGVSLRLPGASLIVGVSGIARWPVSDGGREFGKPDYGVVGRIGFGVF